MNLELFNNNIEAINKYISQDNKLDIDDVNLKKKTEYLQLGSMYTHVLVCKGIDRCVYGNQCPFQDTDKQQPCGDKCPYELWLVNKYNNQYLNSFDVQSFKHHEVLQIIDLVEIELLINRQHAELSNEGMVIKQFKKDGDKTVVNKVENPLLLVLDRLYNRKEKIIKNFRGTRINSDDNDNMDQLKEKLRQINKQEVG